MNDQVLIRLVRKAEPLSVDAVERLTSLGNACAKCAEWGGLSDKVVCIETGIDAGQRTRIKQDQAHPSGEFMKRLMDAAGNEAPLWYLLLLRDYDPTALRKHRTALECRVNKLEQSYASHLELLKRAGGIVDYRFEAVKLRLAANTFYTPDFLVITVDGFELHEVKGFWEDDARVKIKCAAELFPWMFFKAITGKAGAWKVEVFSA